MKLLVVDDENLIARGIAHVIEQFRGPFKQVDIAYSGEDALEQMKEVHYDLLITDISMPGMSGLELIKEALASGLCENFCILSGYSEFEYARTAIRLGVEDYLLKPVDKEKLREMLEAVSRKSHSRDAARQRERKNLLADCLFGSQSPQNLRLDRREPLQILVVERLFQNAGSLPFDDLKSYLDQGLIEDILPVDHLPTMVLFSRPGLEDILASSLLKDFPGVYIGMATGAPSNGAELRKLYERALQAALIAHCFLGKHCLGENDLPVSQLCSQEELERLLARHFGIAVTEGQLLLYQLCWHNLTAESAESFVLGSANASNPYVAQMLSLAECRFTEALTLHKVAKTINLNPEYAGKLFRVEVGMSFSEYLNRYRITRILEFIAHNPSLSFEQLAPFMGFPDLRNFYRVFKRIMQTTPGKYRDSLCPPEKKPDHGES